VEQRRLKSLSKGITRNKETEDERRNERETQRKKEKDIYMLRGIKR
jgi:hypothetical protein